MEEIESSDDWRALSRGISVISVAEDDQKLSEKHEQKFDTQKSSTEDTDDDDVAKLMERINKQRSVLENILDKEQAKVSESLKTSEHLEAEKSSEMTETERKETIVQSMDENNLKTQKIVDEKLSDENQNKSIADENELLKSKTEIKKVEEEEEGSQNRLTQSLILMILPKLSNLFCFYKQTNKQKKSNNKYKSHTKL
jgi:hypothetical protein